MCIQLPCVLITHLLVSSDCQKGHAIKVKHEHLITRVRISALAFHFFLMLQVNDFKILKSIEKIKFKVI